MSARLSMGLVSGLVGVIMNFAGKFGVRTWVSILVNLALYGVLDGWQAEMKGWTRRAGLPFKLSYTLAPAVQSCSQTAGSMPGGNLSCVHVPLARKGAQRPCYGAENENRVI